MASWLTRQYRSAKSWTSKNTGKIGRGAVVAGAAALGSFAGGPAGGIAAAALTDAALGGAVERNVRRGTDRAIGEVQEYFDDPEHRKAPPQLVTELVGVPSEVKPPGQVSRFTPESVARMQAFEAETKRKNRNRALALGGAGIGVVVATVIALKRR